MSNLLNKKHYWTILKYPYLEDARIFVYKEQINSTLYFSANDIAYCLEFNIPHDAIKRFISMNKLSRLPFTSGTFLNTETVFNFITNTLITFPNDSNHENNNRKRQRIKQFQLWFERYIRKCENSKTGILCPQ